MKASYFDKPRYKKIASALIQLGIFVLLFFAISWWQQKDMLSSDEQTDLADISLISTKGEAFYISPKKHDKNILLYFFAPWCSICHASIDNLQAIEASNTNPQLKIYLIALSWQSQAEVEAFLSEHKLTMPVLLGSAQTRVDYKISAFPSYYLIGKNGKLLAKNMGYSTELGLRARLLLTE